MTTPTRSPRRPRPLVLVSLAAVLTVAVFGLVGPWSPSGAGITRSPGEVAPDDPAANQAEVVAETAADAEPPADQAGAEPDAAANQAPAQDDTTADPAGAEDDTRADRAEAAAELDRLIGVFEQRARERNGSLEHRRLGQLLLERAGARSDLGDYRAAHDAFAAARALDPDHPVTVLGLGRAALGVHDFATAISAAETLAELRPDDPETLALVGDVAHAVGDSDRAAEAVAALAAVAGPDPAVLVRQAQAAATGPDADPDRAATLAADAVDRADELDLDPSVRAFYRTYAGP